MKPKTQNPLMVALVGVVFTAELHAQSTVFTKLRSFNGAGDTTTINHPNDTGGC